MILVSDAKCIHLNYPFFQVRYIQLQLRVYSSSGVFKNFLKTYLKLIYINVIVCIA